MEQSGEFLQQRNFARVGFASVSFVSIGEIVISDEKESQD